ncbi:MAG: CoA-transferase [Dehalococcoidia bacterium]|nr:CoA-transferase [Dehalococcoidia bacterium]
MSEKASYFNEREHQICVVARMVEDARTYWVAGGGSPMASILLAKKLYAPNAVYVTEDGVINPEPMLPLDPLMTMVTSRSSYRALQWGTMNTVGFHAQIGLMDYGILNTLQVDPYGNINSTALGDYEGEHRRFGGPGGADSIASMCWKTILMTDQQARKFVPRVDFISSPGFLDGSEGARERAGLPRGTGPWRVVTPWAVFDYQDRHLRLAGVSPFVTVDQVLAEMSFKPLMADEIETLETPTEEELALLRTELDQRGQITDVGKPVVLADDGTYAFGEK